MVPIFRIAFGMSPIMSTATSLFTIIPTSLSGVVQHARNHTCIPKLGVALGIGGACTSSIGVALAQHSPGWAIMTVAAIVIGYSAFTMFKKAFALGKPGASAANGTAHKDAEAAAGQPALTTKQLLIGFGIGAFAGLISGYVGVGGGFIMVPLMLSLIGIPMKLASGTSLIAVVILALPATIEQCLLGNVDFVAGIAIAVGSIPGALIGARLMKRMPERTLRLAFGCFLIVAAILLVAKETGLLG